MNRRQKKKRDKFHELRKRCCSDASYSEMRQIDKVTKFSNFQERKYDTGSLENALIER